MAFLRFFWQALKHYNLRGYIYIWANLAFVLLSLPIITMPAAWAALVRLSHLNSTTASADLHDFWAAFKENLGRGIIIFLISALILIINLSNFYSYQNETGIFYVLLRFLWLNVIFLWFSVQLYVWSIYYEMEVPNLWQAHRNALIMVLRHPFFTFALWIFMLLVGVLSSIFPVVWLLLTFSFFATLSARSSLHHLKTAGFALLFVDKHQENFAEN